jgi:zinc/manganese transport system substrate-binding protein
MDFGFRSLLRSTVALTAVLAAFVLTAPPLRAASKLKIVTATTDLAEFASEVGGDRVEVESIARGYQDPHFVEAKPSFLLKLRRADLLIVVGLQLEIGWLPPLINQCGNPKVQVNAPGYLDASQFAEILEKPTGTVTRAMGDVHPYGNPHYWLDPENGRRIAQGIEQKLAEMRPEDATYFEQRFQDFDRRVAEAEKRWEAEMQPFRGRKVVTYHRSWPNFLKRFGLISAGEIEPRPGIPPSPRHTVDVIQLMRSQNIKVILVEPYFDLKTPNAIARETGGQVVVMLPSVGGEKEVTDYFKLFDYDIDLLTRAFKATQ